jgi:hypothetical protein
MSQSNSEETNILSVDEAVQEEKLVPVSESIRYRKRAQSAEKRASILENELVRIKSENEQLAEGLSQVETEQKLVKKLVSAGVSDLESAILLAKTRIETQDGVDADSVVEQLKKEKRHLFVHRDMPAAAGKTASAKGKAAGSGSVLERAADKAAATGNRADLQEYLKVRRSYV